MIRYGISEWFGRPFLSLSPSQRQSLARAALRHDPVPPCPFRRGLPDCTKRGGVCSIQEYQGEGSRIGTPTGNPVSVCPYRFEERDISALWLAEIVDFGEVYMAREVPFMEGVTTGKPAGKIDLVLSKDEVASEWVGLEIQAVYFSGKAMDNDFNVLLTDSGDSPPMATKSRRPDWRSSTKRLRYQLEVKVPTLRTWGKKLAVSVDLPFFNSIGGPSSTPSHDLNEGDILWIVPLIDLDRGLVRHHWEVLSLEASSRKLLDAAPVKRRDFESYLRRKLARLETQ